MALPPITYRRDLPGPMTAVQLDGNIENLDTRLTTLEGGPGATPNGIADVRQAAPGGPVVVEDSRGEIYGPFSFIPTMRPVGAWVVGKPLAVNDVFERMGTSFLVSVEHTAVDFDADQTAGRFQQLVPYSPGVGGVVGKYDPDTDYNAGQAVTTTGVDGKTIVWLAPSDIEAGTAPTGAPWLKIAYNLDSEIAAIEATANEALLATKAFEGLIDDALEAANTATVAVSALTSRVIAVEDALEQGGDTPWDQVYDLEHGRLDTAFGDLKDTVDAHTASIATLAGKVETLEEDLGSGGGGATSSDNVSIPGGGSLTAALVDLDARLDAVEVGGGGGGPIDAGLVEYGEDRSVSDVLSDIIGAIGAEFATAGVEAVKIKTYDRDTGLPDGLNVQVALNALRSETDKLTEEAGRLPASRVNYMDSGSDIDLQSHLSAVTSNLEGARDDITALQAELNTRVGDLESLSISARLDALETRMLAAEDDIATLQSFQASSEAFQVSVESRLAALESA